MVLVKASEKSEAGVLPSAELLAKMGQFNEELVRAGVLLAADGLQPTSKGTRISFAGPRPAVTDGPFTETKELLAGYWLLQLKSKDEAIAWISRAPFDAGEEVEIRQVYEAEDFAPVFAQSEKG
jgi:hypothetical protein